MQNFFFSNNSYQSEIKTAPKSLIEQCKNICRFGTRIESKKFTILCIHKPPHPTHYVNLDLQHS